MIAKIPSRIESIDGDTLVKVPCTMIGCTCWGFARIAAMLDDKQFQYAMSRATTRTNKQLTQEHMDGNHDRTNLHQVSPTQETERKG